MDSGQVSIKSFDLFVGNEDYLFRVVSREGGSAPNFCASVKRPPGVFRVLIHLGDLIDVTADVNGLDGTPNRHQFIGQVYIDFHAAMLSSALLAVQNGIRL
jgi:hypothetical protein